MEELGTSLETSGEELDACGPDAPTALELFTKLRDASGGVARIAAAGPLLSTATITALTKPIDWVTGDTLLDADDLDLLCSGLTVADARTTRGFEKGAHSSRGSRPRGAHPAARVVERYIVRGTVGARVAAFVD